MKVGDKLRALLNEKEAEALKDKQRAAAEAAALFRAERLAVEMFFNYAFSSFCGAIEAGRLPNPERINSRDNALVAKALKLDGWRLTPGSRGGEPALGYGVWNPAHPHNAVWQAFVERCAAEGLAPVWRYQYDSMGVHSWFELYVEVAA